MNTTTKELITECSKCGMRFTNWPYATPCCNGLSVIVENGMKTTRVYLSTLAKPKNLTMKTGAELIAEERKRQIEVEGFTTESDLQYTNGELFYAGCCYHSAAKLREAGGDPGIPPTDWPFSAEYWKPSPNNRIKEIVKSGALLQAHVDLTGSDLAIEMIKVCAREIDELLKN